MSTCDAFDHNEYYVYRWSETIYFVCILKNLNWQSYSLFNTKKSNRFVKKRMKLYKNANTIQHSLKKDWTVVIRKWRIEQLLHLRKRKRENFLHFHEEFKIFRKNPYLQEHNKNKYIFHCTVMVHKKLPLINFYCIEY